YSAKLHDRTCRGSGTQTCDLGHQWAHRPSLCVPVMNSPAFPVESRGPPMTNLSLIAAATALATLSASTSAQPTGQPIGQPIGRNNVAHIAAPAPVPFVAPAPIREIVDRQLGGRYGASDREA